MQKELCRITSRHDRCHAATICFGGVGKGSNELGSSRRGRHEVYGNQCEEQGLVNGRRERPEETADRCGEGTRASCARSGRERGMEVATMSGLKRGWLAEKEARR